MTDYFEYRYWSTPEGSDVQYNNKLHCLLLVGYDENNYYFHDPMRKAYKGFSKSKVDEAYNLLGKQAVVIIKSGEAPFIPVVEPYEKHWRNCLKSSVLKIPKIYLLVLVQQLLL